MMKPDDHPETPGRMVSPEMPGRQDERIKVRILIPLVLAMSVLLGTFISALHRDQEKQSARSIERSAHEVQNLLRLEQEDQTAVMATTLHAILNDGRLAELFRDGDLPTLLSRAKPLFEMLTRQHQITHFYFHTPGRTNLLRVHRPEQRGDVINRHTLREAERTGKLVSGIERGPIGTFVLRVVSPWRHEGKLLGYLELGVEFEDIIKNVHGLLKADFVVAVSKQFLDRAQWNKGLKTYGRQGSWDQFPHAVVMDKTGESIPPPVAQHLSAPQPSAKGVNHTAASGGRWLQLMFLPLDDVSGKTLGELIVLQDVTESVAQARGSIGFVIAVCLVVSAVLVGLFYLFLTRVERDLAERTSKLKGEIIERQRAEASLRESQEHLEQRVAKRTAELNVTHQKLLESSRAAGMAEVATGVLHNVGNVLNSVNVSATLVTEGLNRSEASGVSKVAALLRELDTDLGAFLANDPKGRQIPAYVSQLAEHLATERSAALEEMTLLRINIEHTKDIVAMQQSYARVSGVSEVVRVRDLVEDALQMNGAALTSHGVEVRCEYGDVPAISVEKHKVLQILVNLIRNAKYACDESGRPDKQVILRVAGDHGRVKIVVSDNGRGIPPGEPYAHLRPRLHHQERRIRLRPAQRRQCGEGNGRQSLRPQRRHWPRRHLHLGAAAPLRRL